MAKFVPFLGNISGKLKSVVFAYNKSGSYIRSWRASTKPFSLAQLTAQSIFAGAVTTWHALSEFQKAAWNMFASTIFHAKHPVTGTAYSGYNAFVSMKNVADNMASKVANAMITSPAASLFTPDFYSSVQSPPGSAFSAQIRSHLDEPLGILLDSVEFNLTDALFTADFNLIGNTGAGITGLGPKFNDAISEEPCGIALYASKPGQQLNQFVSNPEFGLVSVTPVIGQIDEWTPQTNLTIAMTQTDNLDDRKMFYAKDEVVQFKAYLVAKNGQTQPIGAAKSVVQETI
jgi:hypothetical protein